MKNIQIQFQTFLLIVIVFIGQNLAGQTISKIDFDQIKGETQDSSSAYFYPLLLQRFLNFDTTLSEKDHKLLYFGNVYYKNYNPYGNAKGEAEFVKLYNKRNYEEAIPLGKEILDHNPISLEIIYKLIVCYHNLEEKAMARKYASMYFPLLESIYKSGDGKSVKTAYVVVKISDEYEILKDLELYSQSQSLIGTTDMLSIAKNSKGNDNKKKKKKIKQIYFNVSFPLGFLKKQFEKKE